MHGHRDLPVAVCNLGEPAALAAGGYHSLATLSDGTVDAWGYNGNNQLGVGPLPEAPEFGSATSPSPLTVGGLAGVVEISAGETSSLALLKNGTVMGWGEVGTFENAPASEFPTEVPGLIGVVAIAAGYQHSMALLANGTVEAWGANARGELGDGTSTGPERCPGIAFQMPCSRTPVLIPGLTEVTAIAAGFEYSLAVLKNGTVEAWGANTDGRLGVGTQESDVDSPRPVLGLSGVKTVAAGWKHCLALLEDGTVMAWGSDEDGQLGNGSVTDEHTATPAVPVSGLTGATAVAAGRFFSVALRQDGTVVAWGYDGFGELGDGKAGEATDSQDSDVPVPVKNLSNVTAISAGGDHALAIGRLVSPIDRAQYVNWVFSGSLTSEKLRQPITLPAGSTFNGSGEVNTETGVGSVEGTLAVPPFVSTAKLFGVLPASLQMAISQAAPLEGAAAKSESVAGDEALTIPLKLNMAVSSLGVLGLVVPVSCSNAEPVSFSLTDNLTLEELLAKGWRFTGTAALPAFKCEGPFGAVASLVLRTLLSGPNNPYSLTISAPGS